MRGVPPARATTSVAHASTVRATPGVGHGGCSGREFASGGRAGRHSVVAPADRSWVWDGSQRPHTRPPPAPPFDGCSDGGCGCDLFSFLELVFGVPLAGPHNGAPLDPAFSLAEAINRPSSLLLFQSPLYWAAQLARGALARGGARRCCLACSHPHVQARAQLCTTDGLAEGVRRRVETLLEPTDGGVPQFSTRIESATRYISRGVGAGGRPGAAVGLLDLPRYAAGRLALWNGQLRPDHIADVDGKAHGKGGETTQTLIRDQPTRVGGDRLPHAPTRRKRPITGSTVVLPTTGVRSAPPHVLQRHSRPPGERRRTIASYDKRTTCHFVPGASPGGSSHPLTCTSGRHWQVTGPLPPTPLPARQPT